MCVCGGVWGEHPGPGPYGGGGPDLRRGDFVCLHLGSLSLLTTSPHTLSLEKVGVTGGSLAPHLVRGFLLLGGGISECYVGHYGDVKVPLQRRNNGSCAAHLVIQSVSWGGFGGGGVNRRRGG